MMRAIQDVLYVSLWSSTLWDTQGRGGKERKMTWGDQSNHINGGCVWNNVNNYKKCWEERKKRQNCTDGSFFSLHTRLESLSERKDPFSDWDDWSRSQNNRQAIQEDIQLRTIHVPVLMLLLLLLCCLCHVTRHENAWETNRWWRYWGRRRSLSLQMVVYLELVVVLCWTWYTTWKY